MTFRHREEYLTASQEFPYSHLSGSILFSQPAEVDHWCQSIPFGQEYPLTPPDTASDGAISDCQEMNPQPWSQVPLPEQSWNTGSAPEHNMFVPLSSDAWQRRGVSAVVTQGARINNATAWTEMPQGSVDMGLSPVLSHNSQSSYTLNSFSEPDLSALPSNMDLPPSADLTWNTSGSAMYPTSQVMPYSGPGEGFVPAPAHFQYDPAIESNAGFAAPQSGYSVAYQPGFPPQGSQYPTPGMAYAPAVHRRALLPRMDVPAIARQPVYGPQRVLRPQVPVSHGSQYTLSPVSSLPGHTHGAPPQTPVSTQGPFMVVSSSASRLPSGVGGPAHVGVTTRQDLPSQFRPVGSVGYPSDHTEDWSSYIQFDHEDQPISPGTLNYAPGYGSLPAEASTVPSTGAEPTPLEPEQKVNRTFPESSSTGAVVSGDGDEGRHRTHALYSEGPHADGLYHCPFMSDPNCGHKPTKLKCNYDKFIDSHLKPFRCKLEACSKQEFSSTACLLRHEREAHGMHGHGDRPHLCYYHGCERGIAGNGFPRRYNLFDHMKRVHDHKDDSTSFTASPVLAAGVPPQRKAVGRKRKASGPTPTEPATQRQRSTPAMPQVLPVAPVPQAGYPSTTVLSQPAGPPPPQELCKTQHRQRAIHSQWANQRDLLSRQMHFVQGPDDEANLQRLSQNLEELRRLSQEARRG